MTPEGMRLRMDVWTVLSAVRRFDVPALRREIEEGRARLRELGWKDPLCMNDAWAADVVEQLQRCIKAAADAANDPQSPADTTTPPSDG